MLVVQIKVGTWKLTDVKMSETGSYITWPFKTTYSSFRSDGTYYGSGYFGTGHTYAFSREERLKSVLNRK